jgi:hypothetical protein
MLPEKSANGNMMFQSRVGVTFEKSLLYPWWRLFLLSFSLLPKLRLFPAAANTIPKVFLFYCSLP